MMILTVSYEDEQVYNYSDVSRALDTKLDAKTLVDFSYQISDPDNNYSIRAFLQNATDERYRVSAQPVATLWTFEQYGAPRTAGVEMTFSF